MYLDRYKYAVNENFLDYEFTSEGPKGAIRKIIRFTLIAENIYNLAFGDLDKTTGEISDTTVTNNNDSRKILATVAATVHDFTIKYPNAVIFAKGSTLGRTRLYRMGITNHWQVITTDFEIYGLKGVDWEPFVLRKDYDAFLVRRK